jgi:AcrR family transcriptional regulator
MNTWCIGASFDWNDYIVNIYVDGVNMLECGTMKIRVAKKPADAYQHGDLKEALIDAGLRLLSDGGVEALSLRGAAQLAGVSHAAPYRHYKDKEALLAAIGERGFRLLKASMLAKLAASGATHARDKLLALGLGYLAFATEHPAYFRLIFNGMMTRPGTPEALIVAGMEAFALLHETVASGIAARELRQTDVDIMAFACWSLLHGYSTLVTNGAIPEVAAGTEPKLATQLMDLLGAGIDPPGDVRSGPSGAKRF